jgi:hypothetical protein
VERTMLKVLEKELALEAIDTRIEESLQSHRFGPFSRP